MSIVVAAKLNDKVPTCPCSPGPPAQERASLWPVSELTGAQASVRLLQFVLKHLGDGDRSMLHLVVVVLQKSSRSEERREVEPLTAACQR